MAPVKFFGVYGHGQSLRGIQIETFDACGQWLNSAGIKTEAGTPYIGGRGVARLLSAVWAEADRRALDTGPIDEVFVDRYGRFAYAL